MRKKKLPVQRVFIYLWNPLILVSFSLDGHLDSLAICLLSASIYLFVLKKHLFSFVPLALSFLTKLYPLFLFPFFVQRSKRWSPILIFFAVVLSLSIPFYLGAGDRLFHGLAAYSSQWRFNDSLFLIVEWMSDKAGLQSIFYHSGNPLVLSKILIALLYSGTLIYLALKKKNECILKISFWSIGLLLLLSPTFHFWYLTWIVPFLVFFPNRAWLLLTGLIMVSQEVLVDYSALGIWEEKRWVKFIEFVPFYFFLGFDYYRTHFIALFRNPDKPETSNIEH